MGPGSAALTPTDHGPLDVTLSVLLGNVGPLVVLLAPLGQAQLHLHQPVGGSAPEHQKEWFDETMGYMTGRYHELKETELNDLRTLGERFVQPAKRQQAISA